MVEIRPGGKLPGGVYTLGAERHRLLLGALAGGAPTDGSAHPLAAWLVAWGGCGVSIGDLFAAAGVPMEDGPMLGSCDLELLGPIDIEAEYAVSGEIVDLQEKTGRRIGRFDVMTMRMEVRDPGGDLVATCTPSVILPRPGSAA
jgi:hypothetical protein